MIRPTCNNHEPTGKQRGDEDIPAGGRDLRLG